MERCEIQGNGDAAGVTGAVGTLVAAVGRGTRRDRVVAIKRCIIKITRTGQSAQPTSTGEFYPEEREKKKEEKANE